MEPLLFIPIILSFFMTLIALPYWIKKASKIGMLWEDMNKYEKPRVAGSGGLIVILGFILGALVYIFLKTFYFKTGENVQEIFALTTSVLILAIIGLVDDLLGWWHGGLSKKFRILLCLFAAVPFAVINSGNPTLAIPFIDGVNFGILYALLIIPIGIIGASTTFNFLAGFNGLEAGQGIIILFSLSTITYFTGNTWLTLIGLCMTFSLLAFLFFNKFPAKVFPGDVLTYSIGGLIAVIAILGNIEKIAIFFFIPYIIEVILKLRGKLKRQSFGKPNKDGSLEMPYKKIYGLEHFAIWLLKRFKKDKKVYEKNVVYVIWFFQIVIIIIGFVIFKNSVFQ